MVCFSVQHIHVRWLKYTAGTKTMAFSPFFSSFWGFFHSTILSTKFVKEKSPLALLPEWHTWIYYSACSKQVLSTSSWHILSTSCMCVPSACFQCIAAIMSSWLMVTVSIQNLQAHAHNVWKLLVVQVSCLIASICCLQQGGGAGQPYWQTLCM